MGPNPTAYGGLMQPLPVVKKHYLSGMNTYDTKKLLWNNVRARMMTLWGEENLTRLCRDAKIGPGTASRIKEMSTSVGIDVLEKIAIPLKSSPWQLISPNMDNPPPTPKDMDALLKLYNRIPESLKLEAAHTAMMAMFDLLPDNNQPTHAPDQSDLGETPPAKPPSLPAKNSTY